MQEGTGRKACSLSFYSATVDLETIVYSGALNASGQSGVRLHLPYFLGFFTAASRLLRGTGKVANWNAS